MATKKTKMTTKNSSWFQVSNLAKDTAEILIYDEIGSWGIGAKDFITAFPKNATNVVISMNSAGGDVFDGLAIFNHLLNSPAKVTVKIDGLAASIASVIAMAGDEVIMAENAMMMIHNPWTLSVGTAADMRKSADLLDKTKKGLVNAYTMRTGMSDEEVSVLMDAETWMTAEEAVEMGFADTITEPVKIAASFDLSKFRNTPDFLHIKDEVVIMPKETTTPVEEVKNVDEGMIKAQVLKAEMDRRSAIKAVFAKHPQHTALMDEMLDDVKATADVARIRLLDAIGSYVEPVNKVAPAVVVEDSSDKFRKGVVAALHGKATGKPDFNNEFTSHTLFDIAKESLVRAGVRPTGTKMQIVKNAFSHSTSDFPNLIENVLGKELQGAYGNFPETWNSWTTTGSVPDFKVNSRIRLGTFNSLAEIKEGGEYTYGTFGEEKETIQAATKGKAISITRQMIINDDLGGMVRIAQLMGRAAARTVGDDVYAVLTSNPTMADSNTLFHANHSNLGTGGVPTAASFSEAKKLMRMQQDLNGNDYLNIMPKFVLAPVTLEDTIMQLLASETDLTKSNSKVPNTVRNMVQLITDPRLDANSTTAYYFVADPSMTPCVEVVFLDGQQSPYTEQQQGFDIDGISLKIRLDYGVAPTDWRGLVKNAGA